MTGGVVATTGRSGSKRIVEILNLIGFNATHETLCSFEWARRFRMGSGEVPIFADSEVESSGHTIWLLGHLPPETAVLHQVRRPLDVAASIADSQPGWGPWDSSWMQADNVGMDLTPDCHSRAFWLEFWYRYNLAVERACAGLEIPYYRYRIEDLEASHSPDAGSALQAIALHLGREVTYGDCVKALAAVPETCNGRYRQHPDVSWAEAPPHVREMAVRYGYKEAG